MQRVLSNKKAASSAPQYRNIAPSILLPHPQFRLVLDFLEDKWGTNVVKKRNEFFRANQQDRPIARLSGDSLFVALVDRRTGNWHELKTRIEDIELPRPILVERKIYRNLLYRLVRTSGEGIVRWINKFYGTQTGKVIGELLSNEKIRIFETRELFESSRIVSIEDYVAIKAPMQQYFRLLDFLVELTCGEVRRIGNEFYSSKDTKLLDSIVKSPGTVSKSITSYLNTRVLAELVSTEEVRFPDGTTKKISHLLLTRRVHRAHLYFCDSCQSFVRIAYRSCTHQGRSGIHAITYISSSIALLPISKSGNAKKETKKFPESVYKYWGMEKGKVRGERSKWSRGKESRSVIDKLPFAQNTCISNPRAVPATPLLLTAQIIIDGHLVTSEERKLAFQRLERDGIVSQESTGIECKESIGREEITQLDVPIIDMDKQPFQ